MEREIGKVADRPGFEVHVDGEQIILTQDDGGPAEDSDMIVFHVSDAEFLMELLAEAVAEIAYGDRPEFPTAAAPHVACNTPGPHSPDGTCCDGSWLGRHPAADGRIPTSDGRSPIDRSGEMR